MISFMSQYNDFNRTNGAFQPYVSQLSSINPSLFINYCNQLKCLNGINNNEQKIIENEPLIHEKTINEHEVHVDSHEDIINHRRAVTLKLLTRIKPLGKTDKCARCGTTYDKNHMFLLIEHEKEELICFNCSLDFDPKHLRDWEYRKPTSVNAVRCYRCGCFKSKERFEDKRIKKMIDGKAKGKRSKGDSSYCTYCKLNQRRRRMATNQTVN